MPATAKQLAETIATVPSLPAVLSRLTNAIDDPRSSLRRIEAIVQEDSALAGRLLCLANSAYFGYPARVDNLSRAITLVGWRQLRDLTIATSVIDTFRGLAPSQVTTESFWKHSVACGLVARILATWRRESNLEQYFVAGLLHDIGRLVLYVKFPDDMSKVLGVARSSGKLLYQSEAEHLGFDHAAVGGELLKRWNLPAHIHAGVEFHHAPQRAGAHKQMAAAVHIADILVNGIVCGSSGERYVPSLCIEAWQSLDLPPSIVDKTLDLLERQLADALSVFLEDVG